MISVINNAILCVISVMIGVISTMKSFISVTIVVINNVMTGVTNSTMTNVTISVMKVVTKII